jgi:hypothetical protein
MLRPMWTSAGRLTGFLLATAMISTDVSAQTPSSSDSTVAPRDGMAVGIALTPVPLGAHGFYPAVRLTVPLVPRIGLDMDVGRMLPAAGAHYSNQALYGIGVRFLASRTALGSSRYWSLGPVYFIGTSLDGHGRVTDRHSVISAFKLGYGADQIFRNDMRAATEIGVIGGDGRSPTGVYATLAVQWQRRR